MFYIKESNIEGAGNGLFAKESLPEGYKLEVTGVLVKKGSTEDICTRYARDYKFVYDEDTYLVPTGWAGMANHSHHGTNAELVKEDKLYLVMKKAISKDEEILYEYSKEGVLRINMQGLLFAVVALKDDIVAVKYVTSDFARAWKDAGKLEQNWKIVVAPTKMRN